jgi:hypothetical protein
MTKFLRASASSISPTGVYRTSLSGCRTQKKASNIRWLRLTFASMHDQLWDCLTRRVISLPNLVNVAIKAVVPEVQHGATPLYHTWGVLNTDFTGEVTPLSFLLEVEAAMASQGIHMHMSPQRLRGEWLDTICVCGTPDIRLTYSRTRPLPLN